MRKLIFILLFCFTQTVGATAELTFSGLKPIYYVGECITLELQENFQAASRFHRVDLWAAVQPPSHILGGQLLFMTPFGFNPFDPIPQAFRESLETTKVKHQVLPPNLEVLEGMSGTYTFYALYVEEGKNPLTDGDTVYWSNLAQASTTLSDEAPLIPVIDCVSVLPAPSNPYAEAGDSSVILTWEPVAGASSYVVSWQASDGSGASISVTATSFMHEGLINGVSYSYWVTAMDTMGVKGIASLTVVAIPKAGVTPPPAPTPLSVEAGNAQVVFTWQGVTEAVSYTVYWQSAGGAVESRSISGTVFTHNGLVNGTSYTYWVSAVNAAGLESSPSASMIAIPQAPVVVPPPVVTPPVVTPPPTTVASPGDVFRDTLGDGSLGPEMVMIPAGNFQMGDIQGGGDSDEQPVHWVSVNAFGMGRYEVTVGEFRLFVNATGYVTEAEKGDGCNVYDGSNWEEKDDANWRNPYFSQGDNQPVVCVSWNDATAYAAWLSTQTGKEYRLPTEAEWEYATRAGTETSRYWGNNPDDACAYANVHDNTSKAENGFPWTHHNCTDGYAQTAPVGQFNANAFGLFDMLGNVWEWTCSEYESPYNGKEEYCGSGDSWQLVIRGGSWGDEARLVRTADRGRYSRDYRDNDVGFRLARITL